MTGLYSSVHNNHRAQVPRPEVGQRLETVIASQVLVKLPGVAIDRSRKLFISEIAVSSFRTKTGLVRQKDSIRIAD